MRKVFVEAVLVGAVGATLALAANEFSPRGLKLTRNFFPSGSGEVKAGDTQTSAPNTGPATTAGEVSVEKLRAELEAAGLQFADLNLVSDLYRDPRRQQDLIVFIDARDDAHYAAGHIPGAYQLDYYRTDKEAVLGPIIQACTVAQQIVVYCNGGSCEDSKNTAKEFIAPLVPKEKLFVYGGGYHEWTNSRMPIEIGARRSGTIQ